MECFERVVIDPLNVRQFQKILTGGLACFIVNLARSVKLRF